MRDTISYTVREGVGFELPNGNIGQMSDIITVRSPNRYAQEVMLIQAALGTEPDGIIGPVTRHAARQLAQACAETT